MKKLNLFFFVFLTSQNLWAQIDPDTILFGHEATFQDQGMVDESGRMTMETKHKKAKFDKMIQAFLKLKSAPDAQIESINHSNYKPGVKIILPDQDTYIVDMEPVCIEWNQRPLKLHEIEERWAPVYTAAKSARLVPYVNPAAERSGMGHIHIGAEKVSDSPFFKNPLLLRNVMVYFHQHPSLLWGFAEAFDIGGNSNIETYHNERRQQHFQNAVDEFDKWYDQASRREKKNGAFVFLQMLNQADGYSFFQHYRYINLEHVLRLAGSTMLESGEKTGKYTVEFRNIRPYKTPQHAKAMAELLLSVFTPLAQSDFKVPFRSISTEEYRRFHSGLVVADDWLKVKSELDLKENALWESMINEYVENLSSQKVANLKIKGLTVAPAYSEKTRKGQNFEIVLPEKKRIPVLMASGQPVEFQLVTNAQGVNQWVTVIATSEELPAEKILSGQGLKVKYLAPMCKKAHAAVSE